MRYQVVGQLRMYQCGSISKITVIVYPSSTATPIPVRVAPFIMSASPEPLEATGSQQFPSLTSSSSIYNRQRPSTITNTRERTNTTPPPASSSSGASKPLRSKSSAISSGTRRKKKKGEITVVTTILGARRQEGNEDEEDEGEEESDGEGDDEILATTAASNRSSHKSAVSGSTSSKDRSHHRTPESVQLLRPPTDSRDVSVEAINMLDSRFELSRDLGFIERALVPTNTVFKIVGALGSTGSGRSSTLMAVNTTTSTITQSPFQGKSTGMEVFLNAQRRIFLVDYPPVCTANLKRQLDPPVFASQYRDVSRLYDLRMAFTALVTCEVLFLCVTEEVDVTEPIFQLVKAASTIVHRRNWPCARVVLVRNMVPAGQWNNMRRIQADERALQAILGPLSDAAFGGVVHVPKRSSDKETLAADRELARVSLASFAARGIHVPAPSKVLTRVTETEWFSALVYVMNETRTHPFFSAGEDTKWLR